MRKLTNDEIIARQQKKITESRIPLTVGAYTQLDKISDKSLQNFKPVAPMDGL